MKTQHIELPVDLWVEVSADGVDWRRSTRVDSAQELARTCGELVALMRTYVTVIERAAPLVAPISPWFRIVAQAADTGHIVAVSPRRWNPATSQYERTGGDWLIMDHPASWVSCQVHRIRNTLAAVV
ncbi:hypothetical protein TR51_25700 [Kitasatospora griseola]|uniref:Uncharacterized protein n=1 Tax=Kitasatospora griseola TaxID=2064 RepID=A0A0D0PIV7_KITGR|nr:hypothetical protein [Kitasatospora griseola]KIQ61489.1 hypothetical protein TR51_35565 [Kitasatospora griseola]KIQ62434.1 hypothetical protein TR51_25700 [Kitasatospora griseola]